MNPFVFAVKRVLRRPLLVGMLVIFVLAVVLAGNIGGEMSLPPAGVFDGSKSAESGRIVSHLMENGFIACESPEELTELVRDGRLDCGVILPENLVQLMAKNDLDGCIPWIVSPTSFVPELYKDHVAAALFREYAPYITATLFEDTAVQRDDVFQEYEKMFDRGYAFSFDCIMMDGSLSAKASSQRSLVVGASAILLCAIIFAFCADVAGASFRETINRIGLAKAVTTVLLPGLLVRMVLIGCTGSIGLLLAGAHELVGAVLIYTVLLTGVAVILSGLLRNVRYIYTVLSLVIIGSVAVCPIFIDAALTVPVLAVVRYVFPPYWMWVLADNWSIGVVAAIIAQLGGIMVLVVRYATVGKYCLRLRDNKSS